MNSTLKNTSITILLLLLFSLYSCEKRKETISTPKYNPVKINQYFIRADKFYDESEYDSAFYNANKTKQLINPEKDFKRYRTIMFILSMSQQLQGDYSGAESSIVETISTIEKLKKDKYKYKFYNMLAYNFTLQKNYDEALNYYTQSLKHHTITKNKLLCLINIAYIYIEKEQYPKAIKILEELLKNTEIENNKYYHSCILNNLGYCYFKTANPNAINYLTQSLKMGLSMDSSADDDYELTTNYYFLYQYYSKHDKSSAVKYAQLLYQKASEYKNPDDRLLALSLLIKHSSGEELKKYSLNYIHINDSITKVRQKAKNYFAKLKYDSKKEKEENLKLKAEKELQQELERNKNIVITFIIVIIILLAAFIYYYLIEKNKKEKIQTAYNTETRIAKKLHDELANDIYQTIHFAENQDLSKVHNSEKLLENLDTIYKTTRNISRENSLIETGKLYEANLKEMISTFSHQNLNLMINSLEDIDWSTINNIKKITVYRVLQELLVNMKKHSKSNLVIISFKKKDNSLHVNYFDNGKGINLEKGIIKNGLQNIENRLTAINGTITIDSKPGQGVKINTIIPI